MSDLVGGEAELRFTLQITRADTGKVESFDLVGHITPVPQQQILGAEDVSDTRNSDA